MLLVYTHTGGTSQMIAKYRPTMPIVTLVVPHLCATKGLKWELQVGEQGEAGQGARTQMGQGQGQGQGGAQGAGGARRRQMERGVHPALRALVVVPGTCRCSQLCGPAQALKPRGSAMDEALLGIGIPYGWVCAWCRPAHSFHGCTRIRMPRRAVPCLWAKGGVFPGACLPSSLVCPLLSAGHAEPACLGRLGTALGLQIEASREVPAK